MINLLKIFINITKSQHVSAIDTNIHLSMSISDK